MKNNPKPKFKPGDVIINHQCYLRTITSNKNGSYHGTSENGVWFGKCDFVEEIGNYGQSMMLSQVMYYGQMDLVLIVYSFLMELIIGNLKKIENTLLLPDIVVLQ